MTDIDRFTTGAYVLGGRRYRVTLTDAGAGGSSIGALALTRAVPDATREPDGFFIYVRDLESGAYWSAGHEPVRRDTAHYAVRASDALMEIAREDEGIRTRLEVSVAPEGDCELRRLTLENASGRTRRLDVTTYAELVLNTAAADAAHPAFSKLFVQTEWYAERQSLLARRRLRSPEDEPLWAVHLLHANDELGARGDVSYETDRMRFLGRGRSPARPRALDTGVALSGSVGNVLDPVFVLRRTIELAPGASATLVAVLGAGKEREHVEAIAARYDAPGTAMEALKRAKDAGGEIVVVSDGPAEAIVVSGGAPRARPDTRPSTTIPAPSQEPLQAFNGWGGFSADGTEYVIRLDATPEGPRWPPLPWTNVIANENAGFIVSESGAGCTWALNSRENRLTPWSNDPVSDPHGEALYIRDEDAGVFWSPLPGPVPAPAPYEVRHGFGYTRWTHESHDLAQEVVAFAPRHDPLKVVRLRLRNTSARVRQLSVTSYAHLVLGVFPWVTAPSVETWRDADTGALLARNPDRGEFAPRVAVAAAVAPAGAGDVSVTADRAAFLGRGGSVADPLALRLAGPLDERTGEGLDPCAAFRVPLVLAPGASLDVAFLLGEAEDADAARALARHYADTTAIELAFQDAMDAWREILAGVRIETPSPALDLMVNGWLSYQNLSCRVWGRSAFYQSGGAFGFRDQLQDSAALLYLDPRLTRAQILLHAAHQFVEGDVLHWWHPPTSKGMRTRFSDDLLWLPFITAFYLARTGDTRVLDERTRFVAARRLEPGEDEVFLQPRDSGKSASVYEHCCLAIDRSLTAGAHGLPLMGTGDWNDGMNRVGRLGRGESVWLGFFLYDILDDWIPICERRGDAARVGRYREYQSRLGEALNAGGWDGAWYRRAYYDDGAPLGAASNDECRIDTIAQAWSVLSGAAPPERASRALDAMETHLVSEPEKLIRLLTPPFDRTPHDPGYIKGYLPGVRENGGQYTHGVLWGVRALAEVGRIERAARLLEMLSPVTHGGSERDVRVYMTEPYVIAADVYGVAPHVGRGGWTWYTGSAGWMYRVALESILGVCLVEGERIELRPCIPATWPGFTVRYRLPDRRTTYEIVVRRAANGETSTRATVDGQPAVVEQGAVVVPLRADGGAHRVEVVLAPDVGPRYEPVSRAAPLRASG